MHARRRRRKVSGAQSEIGDMSAMMCVLSACIYMQMAARSPMRYLNEFAMRLAGWNLNLSAASGGPFLATGILFSNLARLFWMCGFYLVSKKQRNCEMRLDCLAGSEWGVDFGTRSRRHHFSALCWSVYIYAGKPQVIWSKSKDTTVRFEKQNG